MPIIKKSFGKNYLQCYESEKGKTYSCEQIRKSWDNKVNYVTENSLKNTKEEAQKEFVDAFILDSSVRKNSGRLPMQISLIQPETLPMVVRCSIN